MNWPQVYICPPILSPPPTFLPSGLSQSTGFGCPASCIKLALVIYFTLGKVHIQCYSLRPSHPHLLPLSPKVCSLYLCLLCCAESIIKGNIFLNSIYIYMCVNTQALSFSSWLTSLYKRLQVHPPQTDSNAFLFMEEWYFMVNMYHNLLINSSANLYLGSFHVIPNVNNAAMNFVIHVSLSILDSLGHMPSSGIAELYGSSVPMLSWWCSFAV